MGDLSADGECICASAIQPGISWAIHHRGRCGLAPANFLFGARAHLLARLCQPARARTIAMESCPRPPPAHRYLPAGLGDIESGTLGDFRFHYLSQGYRRGEGTESRTHLSIGSFCIGNLDDGVHVASASYFRRYYRHFPFILVKARTRNSLPSLWHETKSIYKSRLGPPCLVQCSLS